MSVQRRRVRLVPIPAPALAALVAADLARASTVMELHLPGSYLDQAFLWRYRFEQITADPSCALWLVNALVRVEDGSVVGHAGFHGPPDPDGMVEVGYSVVEGERGLGLGHAALAALLARVEDDRAVRTVRASVAPTNLASLAIVRAAGFVVVGEQIDEIDGLELVLERANHAQRAGMHE